MLISQQHKSNKKKICDSFKYLRGQWLQRNRPQLLNCHCFFSPTCVALLLDLCEGPTAMLTLDEDCVSVVFPPSAADSPEMTRPLEKLRFPNKRLSVDEDDETCAEERGFLLAARVLDHISFFFAREMMKTCVYLTGALLMLCCLVLRVDPTGSRVSGDLRTTRQNSPLIR